SQPRREMGRIGAQLLIDRINSKNTRIFRRVVLPVELVERKSVRKIS
ncbi:MAG TPA: LacI family transcriptional regulator, partial [Thermotogales bacterium]|nr:LacI family transcriptional regulator [Thermotogales bacterium]